MKAKILVLSLVFLTFLLTISCDDKETPTPTPTPTPTETISPVIQFVYDGLATYYKWNNEMVSKKPTTSDTDPQTYFKSLLYTSDTQHGWSWLTDDIDGLLDNFAGKSLSFGYNLSFTQMDDGKIYAIVRYVFSNTPAAEVGMKRLHLIGEINGNPIGTEQVNGRTYIASSDIDVLYGNNKATYTLYEYDKGANAIVKDKDVTVTPTEINTNPVLKDSIYEIGDKKIGYLFYTGFIYNYNSELYKTFSKFKNENVTDLVLDLRYNRGGAISSASYLASMIAPRSAVESKSVLTTLSYNDDMNSYFQSKNWSRNTTLGSYSSSNGETDPLTANLNLNKLYVIATSGSYSASELTTFCLKPYMDVVHIGSKTGGKYTASWTIHGYKTFPNDEGYATVNTVYNADKLSAEDKADLKKWGMQPIVAVYTDKNGNTFSDNDGLLPDYEQKEGYHTKTWAPLGDTADPFLGQALYLITGNEDYKPPVVATTRSLNNNLIEHKLPAFDEIQKESVIIDNIQFTPKEMQEMIEYKRSKR